MKIGRETVGLAFVLTRIALEVKGIQQILKPSFEKIYANAA
jgi:hypothetical protein